jgi:hypothetical protein
MNFIPDYDFGPNVKYNHRSARDQRGSRRLDSGELAARTAFG